MIKKLSQEGLSHVAKRKRKDAWSTFTISSDNFLIVFLIVRSISCPTVFQITWPALALFQQKICVTSTSAGPSFFLAQLSFNFCLWEQSYLVLSKIPITQISRLGSKLLAYKQLIQFLFMGLLGEPIMGQSEQISKAKMFKICLASSLLKCSSSRSSLGRDGFSVFLYLVLDNFLKLCNGYLFFIELSKKVLDFWPMLICVTLIRGVSQTVQTWTLSPSIKPIPALVRTNNSGSRKRTKTRKSASFMTRKFSRLFWVPSITPAALNDQMSSTMVFLLLLMLLQLKLSLLLLWSS